MDKLFVANWKMEFSHYEARTWLIQDYPALRKLVNSTDHELIICPSFTELPFATETYQEDPWGAQDCSSHSLGPYTGDISALSLQDLGVSFTLVGHSERRQYYGETNEDVRQKTVLLLEHMINPIVCIGEQKGEDLTEVLTSQLTAVTDLYGADDTLIVAYEPVWAIGTGKTPSVDELCKALATIKAITGKLQPIVLYGGSVNDTIAKEFSSLVDGFLIGSASTDASLLKKIIISC